MKQLWRSLLICVILPRWLKAINPASYIDLELHSYIHANFPNPRYVFAWWMQRENIPNTHGSAYCRWSLGSTLTCTNMKTVRFYVQTAINLHRKWLETPDCKYMENMLIDFIWLTVQAIYLIQTILYHFKWYMALWKRPKCPQYMQRTWWQTVATQHTGLT